jgi:hypothetical protein
LGRVRVILLLPALSPGSSEEPFSGLNGSGALRPSRFLTQLEGKIQERYGYAKDQTQKEVGDWYAHQTW